MGLSNETAPNTAVIDAYRASIDERHARNLASRLIQYEHNPDPREAPSPAPGVRIRNAIDIERSLAASRIPVTKEVAEHNTNSASLGQGAGWLASWQNQRIG
jgi:hypothetical protein